MICSKLSKLIQLQHCYGSPASYWGLARRTWNFSLLGRTEKASMSFSSRWLYCKCKAESTATPNREIQNISSFDSPLPSCTWQRWWISESCNSVRGRHPRPLGTWSPLVIWSTKDWGSSAAVPLPSWSSELLCASVQTPASLQVRHAVTKAPWSKTQRRTASSPFRRLYWVWLG